MDIEFVERVEVVDAEVGNEGRWVRKRKNVVRGGL